MWNFIKSLLTNRFGIVLSAINMCLLINMLMSGTPVNQTILQKIIFIINAPTILLGAFSIELFNALFLNLPRYEHFEVTRYLLPLFAPIQWLFIGWLAKTISQKISRS